MTEQPAKVRQSFLVPEMAYVRKVQTEDVFMWLSKGWTDMKLLRKTSMAYAGLFLFIGLFISFGFYFMGLPYLILPSLTGFLLVGPAIAVGFYEGSRRRQNGEPFTLIHALGGFRRNTLAIMAIGIAQVFLFMIWIKMAFTVFAISFPGIMPEWGHIIERTFSMEGLHFGLMLLAEGSIFAAGIFLTGAFSLPLMVGRKTMLIPAMVTSAYAVIKNFHVMILWAAMITAIMFTALVTGLGLIFAFPLIGHATWHAYLQVMGEEGPDE
ncbi:putative integral membrane protein [Candidatus Terasakiella magnetica]|uniref:Putative integral membrane protein n=1 Tax=Candidatus Terasakiella magnetica TaxID=1867952 RepID=A0A1C3RGH0_9PROT|nr:DUF2189 domain-containing protein [Candidatus Terasakiella magnetica]SCA56380.1 putative integral membrane protein [Candidatus Terasakiella magnetica]